jgi:hypothetical protein
VLGGVEALGGQRPKSSTSAPSASPTVSRRPRIVRLRSAMHAAAKMSLSSASEATSGSGTTCERRKRPTSPSTPPFSWAPSLPVRVNSEENR